MTMNCKVCQSKLVKPNFSAIIFGKIAEYYDCPYCEYVQIKNPDWLPQAYQSPINNCDTGIMLRNLNNSRIILATLYIINNKNGLVVDCAGGYGILVRLLRDQGINALWSDPYCTNLVARGFEHKCEQADLVTAFEVAEHFLDPIAEIEKLFLLGKNLLISTDLIPYPSPAVDEWWYYGLNHGQHIGFFRLKTLQFFAARYKKYFYSNGYNYHLFLEKPISGFQWRLCLRLARYFPYFFSRGLKSKVSSDFEKMS